MKRKRNRICAGLAALALALMLCGCGSGGETVGAEEESDSTSEVQQLQEKIQPADDAEEASEEQPEELQEPEKPVTLQPEEAPRPPEAPAEPQQPNVTEVPETLPQEPKAEITENTGEQWNLVLVNREYTLSRDFQVPETTKLDNGYSIDSRVYPALQEMLDGARAQGYHPIVCSALRSWEKQAELHERKIQKYQSQGYGRAEAEQRASAWVVPPGASEHQVGLAVDIIPAEYQKLTLDQADMPLQIWLREHCAEYGFILRYPDGKQEITQVGYEPWHYRYVGEEAAEQIMSQGICLEEYLNMEP